MTHPGYGVCRDRVQRLGLPMVTRAGGLRAEEAVLKALANRRRLRMLLMLRHRWELHVSGLADESRLPLKMVSRNLRLLEQAGIVLSEVRQGRVGYRLSPNAPPLGRLIIGAVYVSVER